MDSPAQAVAASMSSLTERYRTITHNMANASTVGFKRQFKVMMQGAANASGASSAEGAAAHPTIDFTQGSMVRTGRALDMSLHGKGFFVLETPEGPLYTRDGVFLTNAQSQLVDSAGRTVSGDSGPIVLPPDSSPDQVQVSADGQVTAGGQLVGKLRIVEFEDRSALQPAGAACFTAPDQAAPTPAVATSVQQGFQEASNVTVVEELVDLITVTRMYEANLKGIQGQSDRTDSLLKVAMG